MSRTYRVSQINLSVLLVLNLTIGGSPWFVTCLSVFSEQWKVTQQILLNAKKV